ncbi:LuxR C-terminal-related transcriptional regulator [Pseudomonas sp. NPDC089996]|uniref:LuxR C-terminal-related transcriptional regulator n=1 Tax=Pseudomonas sp. NPDC089996 TaxID=3364474 RepID=UPI0038276D28
MPNPFSQTGLQLPANRAQQAIPDTKVIPPRGARHLIERKALMAQLMEARRKRCVTIQGPAGSGKTSTLLAWRRELLAINFDVCWLSVIQEDNEPNRLSHCLLAALAELDPEVTCEAARLLGRADDELALEHWVIVLVQAVAQRQRDLVLMVDDVHHLEHPAILKVLGWLLDYAPANLHLVLGSRLPLSPSLPLVRLRAQHQLTELDLRALRFSAEESERFLREQLGEISPRDAQTLHELTDGWVAGLQLFAIDLKSRRGKPFNRTQVRDAGTFAHYFEQEVLVRLAPQDREMLTRAAICNRFCAGLCARLLGTPGAIPATMNQLARLMAENLFIVQVHSHDRENWYRLHPLLREVLRTRLGNQPALTLQSLHGTARDWFFEHGLMDEAVRHAVRAGDVQAAADLVEACAHDLMARGDLSHLPNLLRSLPLDQMRERHGLQLAMIQLQLFAHNFAHAQQIIDYLMTRLDRLSLREREMLAVARGALAMQQDDTETLWSLAGELEAISKDADDLVLTGRATVLGWLHMFNGNYDQARRLLEDSDRPGTAPRRTLIGRCIHGFSLVREGQISEAEHLLRNTLFEAESHGDSTLSAANTAACLLGQTLYEQNNPVDACALIEPRLDVLESVSLPSVVMISLLLLADSHWLLGRQLEAQASLDRLEDHALRYGLDRLMAWSLFTRLRWAVQTNHSAQAEQLLAQLEALSAKHAGTDRGVALGIRVLAIRAAIELHLYHQNHTSAVSLLLPLITRMETERRWPLVAFLRVQLAIAEQGCGHGELAQRQLLEALRQGHRLGLVRSLLDVSPQLLRMLLELQERNVLDPVTAFYTQRLLSAATPPATAPAKLATVLTVLSERETEVLQLMAQAMTNKKIARILNVSPETVKWHLKNVFAKLEVSGRDEAIARWRDQTMAR